MRRCGGGRDRGRAGQRSGRRGEAAAGETPSSFNLLGFTHYWGRSRKGWWVVKKKTAKDRFSRSLKRIKAWCQQFRHQPIREQWETLSRKLRGHYQYFGVTGNMVALSRFRDEVKRIWWRWLSRRSQKGYVTWDWMQALEKWIPLPAPVIARSVFRLAAKP